MLSLVRRTATIAVAIVAAACVEYAPVSPTLNGATQAPSSSPALQLVSASANATPYIIDFMGNALPANLAAQVAKAGGVLTTSIDQIGIAVATSDDPTFADRAIAIKGVYSVEPDPMVQWVQPEHVVEADVSDASPGGAVTVEPNTAFGAAEPNRLAQWVPDAMSAPSAWDAGARGAGARVAIVDGGIYSAHVDIAPELDVAHSRSFVPNQPYNFDQARNAQGQCVLNDTFWHGTHVAGIVAAPANNSGTVGIAPSATIIGVKVLHCGSGAFSWVLNGIVYAATPTAQGGAGADIINMSLGASFEHQAHDTTGKVLRDTVTGKVIHTARGAAQLARAIGKATTYAYQQGVTVIAAVGNDATNLDQTNDLMFLPAMAPHVIAVAATGPVGYALGATNFDRPASYTNYGQSAVSFAAGGGDFVLPGNAFCGIPRNPPGTGFLVSFCWAFDLVLAPCRGPVATNDRDCLAAGTSMAAPAVSGVAALIIGKFGRIGPAAVEAKLRASSDDLGKPGNDDFYGGGRVNALRAIH